jgi:opacity protein-like surface antigen
VGIGNQSYYYGYIPMKKQGGMLLASMLVAGAAVAQTTQAMPASSDQAVYVGVEGDYVIPANGVSLPAGFRTTSHSRGVRTYRFLLGYQLSKNWALELAYLTTGDFRQNASNGVINYQARLSAKGEDLALVYRFSEVVPGLFVKAGMSQTRLQTQVTIVTPLGTTARTNSTSGNGYLAGVGYQFDLSNALAARLGYTRYEHIGGQNNIKLNVFSAGLTYRF